MFLSKQWIKNNLLFFISLIVLFLSLVFAAIIISNLEINARAENTRVGHIYLGDDENLYDNILIRETEDFKEQADYQIEYQNQTIEIDLSYFSLDLNQTINQIQSDQENNAVFVLENQTDFYDDLDAHLTTEIFNQVNIESLNQIIIQYLNEYQFSLKIDLNDYLEASATQLVLIEKTYNLSDQTLVNMFPDELVFTIEKTSMFSLIEASSDYTFSNEMLSVLASMMLELTLESHFSNYQFYAVEDDTFDVFVEIYQNNQIDFEFYNDYNQNYEIIISKNQGTMTIQLIGSPYLNTYTRTQETVLVPYETIYIDDSELTDSQYIVEDTEEYTLYQRLVVQGENGEITAYQRTIVRPGGSTSTIRLFFHRIGPVDEIIHENTVQKEGN